ncbi:thioredoxin family protein [Candidatus Enterococcus mansonii]|uniref:Uncharacterized protein n=1 Tax=Candidatus Enterococcus mansonii TaxID=1834181 RepID=A0A242CEY3_9ENTE|nr:thioredoxin family protein [Enterococcus sp. 4G2_DIV0659]OTO08678.1 hypothetical protein A5880_001678 [Enterococcus sp. 4G2_DIV0659]
MKKIVMVSLVIVALSISFVFFAQNASSDYTTNKIEANQIKPLLEKKTTSFILIGNRSCGECERFKPILEEAIQETKTVVHYLDTENSKNHAFLKEHNITATPTLLVIENGEMKRVEGRQEPQEIKDILLRKTEL